MDACAPEGAPNQLVYTIIYTVGNNLMSERKYTWAWERWDTSEQFLPVTLGQHRACGLEHQLEKITARYLNIEKTLQNPTISNVLDVLRPHNHCLARETVSHVSFVSLDELYTPCQTWKVKISSQTGQKSTVSARFLSCNGARSLAVLRVRVQNPSADWLNHNDGCSVQRNSIQCGYFQFN